MIRLYVLFVQNSVALFVAGADAGAAVVASAKIQ